MAKKTQLSKAAQARVKNYEAKSNQVESGKAVRRRDNRIALIAGVVALAIAFAAQLGYAQLHPTPTASPTPIASASATPSADPKVPSKSLAEDRTWNGTIYVNGSPLSIQLDGRAAPQAVANFVSLAQKGFYNDTTCHRLVTTGIFVLQCGDPTGTGTGGPGYSFGPIENVPADGVYKAGTIAMANTGQPNSMGSQFFIVYSDTSRFGGQYSVFGKVTKGLDVIQAIAKVGTDGANGDGKPRKTVTIKRISVK